MEVLLDGLAKFLMDYRLPAALSSEGFLSLFRITIIAETENPLFYSFISSTTYCLREFEFNRLFLPALPLCLFKHVRIISPQSTENSSSHLTPHKPPTMYSYVGIDRLRKLFLWSFINIPKKMINSSLQKDSPSTSMSRQRVESAKGSSFVFSLLKSG